jgi:hypothetical protein
MDLADQQGRGDESDEQECDYSDDDEDVKHRRERLSWVGGRKWFLIPILRPSPGRLGLSSAALAAGRQVNYRNGWGGASGISDGEL